MTSDDVVFLAKVFLPAIKAAVDAKIKKAVDEIPRTQYRGVYATATPYSKGDLVTHQGSVWHCNTTLQNIAPGTQPSAWTLAVKRGPRGRDGDGR
jgi:hypothetical protein